MRPDFAINHAAAPGRGFEGLLELARALGLAAVEIRNDLAGVPIADGTGPERVRAAAEAAGVRILSINALQRFNDWSPARAREALALAGYARACGVPALVLCPVNDPDHRPSESERLQSLRQALSGLAPILADAGIIGLVEPLGFEASSLRLKAEALAAIDEQGLGERFLLVHDTFHHHLAGEADLFPQRTGLVHISGVEDRGLALDQIRDAHRVLVGPADRLGNLGQMAALAAGGYRGPFSFEPFAASVQTAVDIEAELGRSLRFLEDELADVPA